MTDLVLTAILGASIGGVVLVSVLFRARYPETYRRIVAFEVSKKITIALVVLAIALVTVMTLTSY